MLNAKAPIKLPPLMFRGPVLKLLIVALLAETGYAVVNISTMQVYLRTDRGFGESLISLVLVAFLFSEAVFKGPMGLIADRFGARIPMTVGPALPAVTAILSLVVPHNAGVWEVLAFVGLRALDGVGAAMLWPAAFALMGDTVSDSQRQQAMSLLNICYMLGIAIALPLGGIANDLAHVKWAGLVLASVLFAIAAVVAYRSVPSSKNVVLDAEHTQMTAKQFFKSVREIPAYLVLAVVIFVGVGFPMATVKLFALDQFQLSETQFGSLVFPAAIAMAISSVPLSKFGERIGRARAVHVGIGACAFGMLPIAGGAIFPFLRHPSIVAIAAIPVGIGFLLAIPAWMASVSDIDPRRRGVNLGAVMTAQGLGAIVGAPLGGLMYEKLQPVGIKLHLGSSFGHYSPFVGCAACLFVGWLVSLRIIHDPVVPTPEAT